MAHMTAAPRSVSQIVGRSENPVNGDNERPYGKCYGQVGGQSYPCTQDEKRGSEKLVHGKRMRCVETGEEFASVKAAAESIGIPTHVFRYHMRNKDGYVFGKHYEAVQ